MNRELELAWAAGFFDGEGYIGREGKRVRLAISQNETGPLERFAAAVGLGVVQGPYQHTNGTPFWMFRARAAEVRPIMALVSPYLSETKRNQYSEALFAA